MKRFSKDFGGGTSEKRAKIRNEDLWDDSDPDVDDFFLQASQTLDQLPSVAEQPPELTGNESVLSYKAFNRTLVASTQLNASAWAQPTATTSEFSRKCKEHEELRQLKEVITSKDGEISILRAQLKQTKEQAENAYTTQLNDTLDKLRITQKERDTFSTKLEFKDLEIVNLKKKLSNVTRNYLDDTSINVVGGETSVAVQNSSRSSTSYTEKNLEAVTSIEYPLQSVIPVKIFESKENDKFPKILHSKQLTDERYLHSLVCPNLQVQTFECQAVFTYIRYGTTLQLQHFFKEIRFLQDAPEWQLLQETQASSQIYLLTLTLLINQLNYLAKFTKSVKTDEIREYDLRNLQYPNRIMMSDVPLMEPITCDNNIEECAIQTRQCVALVAAFYPHNRYLRNLIINNKLPQPTELERKSWVYSFPEVLSPENEHHSCLKLLHQIVLHIGDIRRADVYIGFLCSICYLLTQIIKFIENDEIIYEICKLILQITLTTPAHPVLFHLSEVFNQGSTNTVFVAQLCHNRKSNVQKKIKKSIMLINGECCIIETYFRLCRESLEHNSNDNDFRMQLNLIQFVENCNARWMHVMLDNSHFDCQKEYYRLTIDVINSSLLKYKMLRDNEDEVPQEVETIVRKAPSVLGMLFKNFGELIEFDTHYNAVFKNLLLHLRALLDKFLDWSQCVVETVKHTTCDSPRPSWNDLMEESLTIDI